MFFDTVHQSRPAQRRGLGNIGRISQLFALRRSRRGLTALTPEQLLDVGLTRAEADREARRAFWDAPDNLWRAPAHWRR